MKELLAYLDEQFIPYEVVNDQVVKIGEESFILTAPTEGKLFDDHFRLIADLEAEGNNYIYQFGGIWYYTPKDSWSSPTLNRVRDIGNIISYIETESFLGVHSTYEILNGIGLYKDWVKRAKFLGVKTLAICEKNSLAGSLKFQIECKENGIKPIIGATYTVYRKSEDYKYEVKCYVKNEKGWENLLLINKEINVINQKYIEETVFNKLKSGLFVVYDPKAMDFDKVFPLDISNANLYYALDTVEYEDNDRDKAYLLNLKKFVRSKMHPIAITDAYYINKDDAYLKTKLNSIGENRDYKAANQYFKSKDDYYLELASLFKDPKELDHYFIRAVSNEMDLVDNCAFEISQEGKHLPDYHLLPEQEVIFGDKETLFWHLIESGLENVPADKVDEYLARVEKEVKVIKLGGFIDYFLILWDIIQWSNANGILTGIGRGSAGGSLVAYLLGITRINPLEFGLIFERFLNEGRVGTKKEFEVFIINSDIELDSNDEILIYRGSQNFKAYAKDLQLGDQYEVIGENKKH